MAQQSTQVRGHSLLDQSGQQHHAPNLARSAVSLVIACIGVGILSFPLAMSLTGIVASLVMMVAVAVLNTWTLHVLTTQCVSVASRGSLPRCYEELVALVLGQWPGRLASIVLFFNQVGTLIGFLVVLLDLCLPLADLMTADAGAGHPNVTHTANNTEVQLRWGVASSLGLLLLPLSMIERIHNLAGCSFLSAAACMLTVMAVVAHAVDAIAAHTIALHSVSDALFGPLARGHWQGTVESLPLLVFAVNCHVHLVPVWVELAQVEAANKHGGAAITHNAELAEALTDTNDGGHDVTGVGDGILLGSRASRSPSYRQIRLAGALTMFGCSGLYFVTGVCGYVALGEGTAGDVLKSYPLSDPWVDAARVAMGVHLFFAFPLSLFPLWKTVRFWTSTPWVSRMSMDEAAMIADVGRVDDVHEESARSYASLWARCVRFGTRLLFHVTIVVVVVVIAVRVPQASDVFSVVGGTFGSTLVYLFPCAMRLRSFASAVNGGRWTASSVCGVAVAGFALVFGIFVAVISTLCSISVLDCGAIGKAARNVTRLQF